MTVSIQLADIYSFRMVHDLGSKQQNATPLFCFRFKILISPSASWHQVRRQRLWPQLWGEQALFSISQLKVIGLSAEVPWLQRLQALRRPQTQKLQVRRGVRTEHIIIGRDGCIVRWTNTTILYNTIPRLVSGTSHQIAHHTRAKGASSWGRSMRGVELLRPEVDVVLNSAWLSQEKLEKQRSSSLATTPSSAKGMNVLLTTRFRTLYVCCMPAVHLLAAFTLWPLKFRNFGCGRFKILRRERELFPHYGPWRSSGTRWGCLAAVVPPMEHSKRPWGRTSSGAPRSDVCLLIIRHIQCYCLVPLGYYRFTPASCS